MPHHIPQLRITPRLWVVLPLGLLSGFPVGLSAGVLLLFHDPIGNQLGSVVSGGVVASVVVTASRWEYWRLPLSARQRIGSAVRTGAPTGDAQLDRLALQRLTSLAARANRVILPVLLILLVSLPVAAAVRVSAWWLAAAPLPLVVLAQACRNVYARDLPERRARLAAAVHGDR